MRAPLSAPTDLLTQGAVFWSEAASKAESALLGCVLIDRRAMDTGRVGEVTPDDFHSAQRAEIWRAVRLSRSGDVVEVIRHVSDATRERLWGAGSVSPFVLQLMEAIPTAANVGYYAEQVLDLSARRRLWVAGHEIARRVAEAPITTSTTELLAESERVLDGAEVMRGEELVADRVGDLMRPVLSYVQDMQSGLIRGVPTGFRDLDDLMGGGFQPAEFTILAGRPSMGKTSLLSNCLLHQAGTGIPVAVFSIEVPKIQFVANMTCSRAGVPIHDLKSNRATREQNDRFTAHAEDVAKMPLYVVDRPSLKIEEMASQSRRLVKERGVKLVGVDYAQLLETAKRVGSERERIDTVSKGLKRLARELEIPVVAAAQINRPDKQGRGKVGPPSLADLKGSGGLEENADMVILLHRPDYYEATPSTEDEVTAYANVGKNRHGPTGPVELVFHKAHMRFENAYRKSGWKPKAKGAK